MSPASSSSKLGASSSTASLLAPIHLSSDTSDDVGDSPETYRLGYSPDCVGCKGACRGLVSQGALRLDVSSQGEGQSQQTTQSGHWGCTTKGLLEQLARIGVDSVSGWDDLCPDDKRKVRRAVDLLAIEPNDIPKLAKVANLPTPAPTATAAKKRPRPAEPTASTSQAGASTPRAVITLDDEEEEEEEEEEVEISVEEDVHFASCATQVVGVQHYRGMVGAGEEVRLEREPRNAYDSNAIRALNICGGQVGHIPRGIASRLAPLLDQGVVRVEGVMAQGNLKGNPYKLDIRLHIFGPESRRQQLAPSLRWAIPVSQSSSAATGSQTGIAGTSSSTTAAQTAQRQREMQKILSGLKKIKEDEKRGDEVLDSLTAEAKDLLDLPHHPNPPGTATGELRVDLLPYQSQGLQWMINSENPQLPTSQTDAPVQLIQLQSQGSKSFYYNLASKSPSSERPSLGRGGLLSDGMGLGKTLRTISLIIATRNDIPQGYEKTTLIVCPVSILSNWTKQITDHVQEGLLSVHVYHGDGRNISAAKLAKFDVVITAYPALSSDLAVAGQAKVKKAGKDDDYGSAKKKARKSDGPLFQLKWKRVVLDEGHVIKNPKARMSKAACALQAHRRWVATGTPIINSPSDLGSILTFLQVCKPLDSPEMFKRLLLRPLAAGDPGGSRILKAVMTSICLRRTKEMNGKDGKPIVALPEIDFFVVSTDMDPQDRQIYDAVAENSKRRLQEYLGRNAGDNDAPTYANVLSLLTRMRQLALHTSRVPADYLESLRARPKEAGVEMQNVSGEDMARLQKVLRGAINDAEECAVCFDIMGEPRILPCAHFFCKACIELAIETNPHCPMDRRLINKSQLIALPPLAEDFEEPVEEEVEAPTSFKSSAKIRELLKILSLVEPDSKTLVFSQFTKFLDVIAPQLEAAGISFCRFDGAIPAKKREEIIRRFSQPIDLSASATGKGKGKAGAGSSSSSANPQVLLISFKAGALGLNLTAANNVCLMDPWWQSSIESQAVDRVYRIGQTKKVNVFQFVAKDTVEAKVLGIQERKNQLISQAFSGIKNAEQGARQKKEARFDEIRHIFGLAEDGEA